MKKTLYLQVHLLGGFSMIYGDQSIVVGKGNQGLAAELLQNLFLHRESGVSKEDLIENFYGTSESENKNNSLNNLIYRLKKQLKTSGLPDDEYIVIENGICKWSSHFEVQVDTEEVKRLCQILQQKNLSEEEQLKACREMFLLYRGELLPHLAGNSWVYAENNYLKKLYENEMRLLCDMLYQRGEYQEMYEVCARVSLLYPFEDWQVGQMESLMQMERYDQAHELYKQTVRMYTEELGLPPSDSMIDCLQQMQARLMMPEESIERIRRLIQEYRKSDAYYSSFPSFVDTYRILCRMAERSGQKIALMSCTLHQIQTNREKKNNARMADWLRKSICQSLRQGDLCSRYSRNQFLILLTGICETDYHVVFDRIKEKFYGNSGSVGYNLTFTYADREEKN